MDLQKIHTMTTEGIQAVGECFLYSDNPTEHLECEGYLLGTLNGFSNANVRMYAYYYLHHPDAHITGVESQLYIDLFKGSKNPINAEIIDEAEKRLARIV